MKATILFDSGKTYVIELPFDKLEGIIARADCRDRIRKLYSRYTHKHCRVTFSDEKQD